MIAPATEARIYKILSDLSAVPQQQIKRGDRLREDLGLDSVSSMELVSMLSEEFSIDVELEEAVRITDVAGLLALAENRIGDA
ncbi:MAG: acyl carrier protein [Deltaproteobacteria bacterium]|nr:acyl carrier protein [Deltaproteobacteria bacterium]